MNKSWINLSNTHTHTHIHDGCGGGGGDGTKEKKYILREFYVEILHLCLFDWKRIINNKLKKRLTYRILHCHIIDHRRTQQTNKTHKQTQDDDDDDSLIFVRVLKRFFFFLFVGVYISCLQRVLLVYFILSRLVI